MNELSSYHPGMLAVLSPGTMVRVDPRTDGASSFWDGNVIMQWQHCQVFILEEACLISSPAWSRTWVAQRILSPYGPVWVNVILLKPCHD